MITIHSECFEEINLKMMNLKSEIVSGKFPELSILEFTTYVSKKSVIFLLDLFLLLDLSMLLTW